MFIITVGVVVSLLLIIIIGIVAGIGIGYMHYREHCLKKFPVIENNYVEGRL